MTLTSRFPDHHQHVEPVEWFRRVDHPEAGAVLVCCGRSSLGAPAVLITVRLDGKFGIGEYDFPSAEDRDAAYTQMSDHDVHAAVAKVLPSLRNHVPNTENADDDLPASQDH